MKTLLVLVDLQNDFIDGSLGTPEAQAIIPNVIELIKLTDAEEIAVTQDKHYKYSYLSTFEGKRLPIEHCLARTKGHQIQNEILQELYESGKSIVPIHKSTFASSSLVQYIQDKGYDKIEIAGLCTDICVVSNALLLRAVFSDTPITVYADCCAGTTPENHEAALKVMKSCQIDVVESCGFHEEEDKECQN